MDYKRLHTATRKDAYPLPRMDDVLKLLRGAEYFATLDLASAYWKVDMAEQDRPKTAHRKHQGLF